MSFVDDEILEQNGSHHPACILICCLSDFFHETKHELGLANVSEDKGTGSKSLRALISLSASFLWSLSEAKLVSKFKEVDWECEDHDLLLSWVALSSGPI